MVIITLLPSVAVTVTVQFLLELAVFAVASIVSFGEPEV
jgi:hypothetical protein